MSRRTLEVGLVLFGAAFLAVVLLSYRPGSHDPARPAARGRSLRPGMRGRPRPSRPASTSPNRSAGSRSSGSRRGRRRASARVRLPEVSELYAGEGVTLTLYPETGSPVTVESERAEYDSRAQRATLEGNVRWSDGKGALAETGRVTFESAARLLQAPGPIHFRARRVRSEREVRGLRARTARPAARRADRGDGRARRAREGARGFRHLPRGGGRDRPRRRGARGVGQGGLAREPRARPPSGRARRARRVGRGRGRRLRRRGRRPRRRRGRRPALRRRDRDVHVRRVGGGPRPDPLGAAGVGRRADAPRDGAGDRARFHGPARRLRRPGARATSP